MKLWNIVDELDRNGDLMADLVESNFDKFIFAAEKVASKNEIKSFLKENPKALIAYDDLEDDVKKLNSLIKEYIA